MRIYVKKLFSYKKGTDLTTPQKKINKSKIGTSSMSAGLVSQNCVHLYDKALCPFVHLHFTNKG